MVTGAVPSLRLRFVTWLAKKIEDCEDLDERVGLKSLMDIITQVRDVRIRRCHL